MHMSRKGTGALSRNVDIDKISLPGETRGSHVVAVGGIKLDGSYTKKAQRDSPVRGEVDGRREASEDPSVSANPHPTDSARTTSPSADDQGNMAHGVSSPVLATSLQSRDSTESSSPLGPPRSDGRVLADSLSVSRLPLALSSLFSLPPVFLFLLFVSIGCCLACITISSTLVYKHLTNYYEPHLQRYVCRICLVGPAFALASLIYFAHTLLSISPESDPTLSAASLASNFAFWSAAPPAAASSLAAVGGEAGEAFARSRRLPLNAAVPFKDSLSTLIAGTDEPVSSGARLEEVFIDFLRDLAQAVALYSFLVLMINCCGNDRCISMALACDPKLVKPVPPFNLFFPSFHPGPHILRYLKVGVMQFVLVVPLVGIVSLLQALAMKPGAALFVASAVSPPPVFPPVSNATPAAPRLRPEESLPATRPPSFLSLVSSGPSPALDSSLDQASGSFPSSVAGVSSVWTVLSSAPAFLSLPVSLPLLTESDVLRSPSPSPAVSPSEPRETSLQWSHFLGMPGLTSVALLASVFTCMLSLLQFYLCTEPLLRPYKPLQKFLSIKVLVFFQVWQRLAIRTLLSVGLIEGNTIFAAEQMADLYHNILMSVWMVFISISHVLCFPVSDHLPEIVGGTGALCEVDPPSASFFQGLLEVLLAVDVLQDAREIALLPHRSLDRACSILREQCMQADSEFQHLLSLDAKTDPDQLFSSPYVRHDTGEARTPAFALVGTPAGGGPATAAGVRRATPLSRSPAGDAFRFLESSEHDAGEGACSDQDNAEVRQSASGTRKHLDRIHQLRKRSRSEGRLQTALLLGSENLGVHRSFSSNSWKANPAVLALGFERPPPETHHHVCLGTQSSEDAATAYRLMPTSEEPALASKTTVRDRGDEENGGKETGETNMGGLLSGRSLHAREPGMGAAPDTAVHRGVHFVSDSPRPQLRSGAASRSSPSCHLLPCSPSGLDRLLPHLHQHREVFADNDSDEDACPPPPPSSPVSGLPSPRLSPYLSLPRLSSSLLSVEASATGQEPESPRGNADPRPSGVPACVEFSLSPRGASLSCVEAGASPQSQASLQGQRQPSEAVQTPFFSPASRYASLLLASAGRMNLFGAMSRVETSVSPYSPLAASVAATVPGAVPYPRSATGRAAVAARFRVASSPTSPFHRCPAAALAVALGTEISTSSCFLEEIPEVPSGDEENAQVTCGSANNTRTEGASQSGDATARLGRDEERGSSDSEATLENAERSSCRREDAAFGEPERRPSSMNWLGAHHGSRDSWQDAGKKVEAESGSSAEVQTSEGHSEAQDAPAFPSSRNQRWEAAAPRHPHPSPSLAPNGLNEEAECFPCSERSSSTDVAARFCAEAFEFRDSAETPECLPQHEEGAPLQLPQAAKEKRGMHARRRKRADTDSPRYSTAGTPRKEKPGTARLRVFEQEASADDSENAHSAATLKSSRTWVRAGPEFGADLRSLQRSVRSACAKGEEEADQGTWPREEEREVEEHREEHRKQRNPQETVPRQVALSEASRHLLSPASRVDETSAEAEEAPQTVGDSRSSLEGKREARDARHSRKDEVANQWRGRTFMPQSYRTDRQCASKVLDSRQTKTKNDRANDSRERMPMSEGHLVFSIEQVPGRSSVGETPRMLSGARELGGRKGAKDVTDAEFTEDSQTAAATRESSANRQRSGRTQSRGREDETEKIPGNEGEDSDEEVWADAQSMRATESPVRLGWTCEVGDDEDDDGLFY
ncbi:organic solute transporter ostalpha protein [Toxoplasma gondii p89]|uniref:Organic solute transporter ostalpha protein n=1 Tax=Toxoplasma gondii p89 TaxID=943119 RepID=A0A086J849_TOXGO|nr:organic solute transporter ostalpha protein [Toxoplasma gondii p89]